MYGGLWRMQGKLIYSDMIGKLVVRKCPEYGMCLVYGEHTLLT